MSLRVLAAVAVLSCLAPAREVQARPPLVPQEMIDACASVSAGAACTFVLSKRTIEGTCAALPDQTLACRPGGPKKTKGKPPAKAP